jgi:hypothetical protein
MAGQSSCESSQPISTRRAYSLTSRAALVALLLAVWAAGCGGDDEDKGSTKTPSSTRSTTTQTATSKTTKTGTETNTGGGTPATTSPENQPGGAGDEEANRAPALFTGKGGRVTPLVVRVPSFIAIRVELRSADGRTYGLRFGRTTLRAGPQVASMSTSLSGLRHGQSIMGQPLAGTSNAVRIEASAEPGP